MTVLSSSACSPVPALGWRGRLALRYAVDGDGRCVGRDEHHGPLRVLKALYPEGAAICQHVLVHPPGGIVGGDVLDIDVQLEHGAHALLTTPGATRFYRSAGAPAQQQARLQLAGGARLEWLPLEAIAYPGCLARNGVEFSLQPGAEMIGWDLLALGLPASDGAFGSGRFEQCLAWPGVWLERGTIDARDTRWLSSPLGLGGHRALATAWFAAGAPLATARRDALVDAARAACDVPGNRGAAAIETGTTSPEARLVVVRVLAARIEEAFSALSRVRAAWRREAWSLDAAPPRVWRT
jgi:urease accessory protein